MFRAFSRPSSGAQWLHWQPLVLPSYRGDSHAVFMVGPAGQPARPRTQHDCHHDRKVKPEAANAVIELLMMGGKMPETCWAVNKRQDNKLENCCIWLVIYLNSPRSVSLTAWKSWNFIVQSRDGLHNLKFSSWQIQQFLQYPDCLWGQPSYGMILTTHLHPVLRCSLTFSRNVSVLNTENVYVIKSFQLAYKKSKNYKTSPQTSFINPQVYRDKNLAKAKLEILWFWPFPNQHIYHLTCIIWEH